MYYCVTHTMRPASITFSYMVVEKNNTQTWSQYGTLDFQGPKTIGNIEEQMNAEDTT